ncbi:hypothetical protein HK101_007509 [Irineochytrium annulatum]|nr:hypothetical protein HK101_007509 [Irineochytrium annulatum]
MLPRILISDVLLAIFDHLDDAALADCLVVSRSTFLLAAPVLWSRTEPSRLLRNEGLKLVADTDPPRPLQEWSRPWRLALYLRSVHQLIVHYNRRTPVAHLTLLGYLDSVTFVSSEMELLCVPGNSDYLETAVSPDVQPWVDAVLDLLRTNRGPRFIHIRGGFAYKDVLEFLSFKSVQHVGLDFPSDVLVASALTHPVCSLAASPPFVRAYLSSPDRSSLLRSLTINRGDRDGTEASPCTWNLPVLTHLAVRVDSFRQTYNFLSSLLTATRSTLRSLKIEVYGPNSLTDEHMVAIASLPHLLSLDYETSWINSDLSPLARLTTVRSLRVSYGAIMAQHKESLDAMLRGMVALRDLRLLPRSPIVVRLRIASLAVVDLLSVTAVVEDWWEVAERGRARLSRLKMMRSRMLAYKVPDTPPSVDLVKSGELVELLKASGKHAIVDVDGERLLG